MNILNRIEAKLSSKKINWLLTIYFNFRMLSFKDAIHFPIFIYGSWTIRCLGGDIEINSLLQKGMIKMGINIAGYVTSGKGYLNIAKGGKIIFDGHVQISQGCSIVVMSNAILQIGKHVNFGDAVKVVCSKEISIGKYTDITWETQVFDYNFHFIQDINTNMIASIRKSVQIGKYNWIGNRTTIMRGTCLPDYTIVASHSLLNKDYIKDGIREFSVLAGIPAKVIKYNCKRIYSPQKEVVLQEYFNNHEATEVSSSILTQHDAKK
jgi:acetyltransferase-like isoleucine patch superfamily enzyme